MKSERPFWWPDAQGFAAGSIVLICAAALFVRMFHASNVDDKMLDTMITVLFTTCLVGVYNYLFGSSRGSAAKDDTIQKIAGEAKVDAPKVQQ
jgi:H+/Cl- antiporter ClcA